MPTGVIMPVINSAGVISNPGLKASLLGLATRTYWRLPRPSYSPGAKDFAASRSSIGIWTPSVRVQSMVDKGMAT